jgi:signal transduction histidine kinase
MFAYLFFFTSTFIIDIYKIDGISVWAWNFGKLHLLFDISFCLLWIIALFKLFKVYKSETGKLKLNLKNMFLALFLGIIPPSLANIILPTFGNYSLNWFGPITSFIWISIVAYSIIKYRQMNVRTVIAEVLALGMTVIFFINIFINIYTGISVRVVVFGIFITLAIYLIRVSLREAKLLEELHSLNTHLAEKVAEQTQEIKKSYELEKKARRDLEKLNETKDQFIMITQHNLRTPVTSIRWELESILSGAHGEISKELRETLEDTSTSVHRLIRIVDDFLNITALKIGSKILNISAESMKPLLDAVLKELRIDIEEMHLSVKYDQDEKNWPKIKIDSGKVREVLLIVMENAIRYNIDYGHISIENKIDGNLFEMTITNTGIGITDEENSNLFNRLFYRGKRSQAKNPTGMGVGLSVARAVMRAHHGDIIITSDGENKGAKVVLTLPFDFINEVSSATSLS